jgi:hypothetical protein
MDLFLKCSKQYIKAQNHNIYGVHIFVLHKFLGCPLDYQKSQVHIVRFKCWKKIQILRKYGSHLGVRTLFEF